MDTNPYILSLTFFERITLGNNLPQQGDFILMTRAKQIAEKLNLTEDEMKEWKVVRVAETGQIVIPPEAMKYETNVDIGQVMFDHFKKFYKDKEASANLAFGDLSLYEKFCEPSKPPLGIEG